MPASYVAASIGDAMSDAMATSSGISIPSSASVGDYAIVGIGFSNSAARMTPPSGWTVLSGPTVTGSAFVGYLLGKTLVSGDPGKRVVFQFDLTGRMSSQMTVYRGITPSSAIVATPLVESSSNSTATVPTIENVPAGLFHVHAVQRVNATPAPDVAFSGYIEPSSNARHATEAVSSSNISSEAAYKIISLTGTYGGETFPLVSGVGVGIVYAVAIPASGSDPLPSPPVAQFSGTPLSGPAPLVVAFTSSASTGGPFSSVSWEYGDGQIGTANSPNHEYTVPGTYTVKLTVTNASGSDSEIKTSYVTVGEPGTGGSQYVSRSTAPMTTPELLARSGKTVVNGRYPTKYSNNNPGPDKTFDCRTAWFDGYFESDAIFGRGRFASTPATDHEKNQIPLEIGDVTPGARTAIIGGKVTGDQPTTLTWNTMKHGSHIQKCIDDGGSGDSCWNLIVNNQNMDGDARIKVANGSWAVIDGLRSYNSMDGIGIYGETEQRTDNGKLYIRNSWILRCRDDSIENDRSQLPIEVVDCLFEECFSFLSTRSPDETGTSDGTHPQIIKDSIVWLKPYPGTHKQPTSFMGHGYMYKMQTNSPPMQLDNVIFAIEKPASSSGYVLPNRSGDSYKNVTIVWLGSGSFPASVPPGVTVTTNRAILDDAVADWKARHGVPNTADKVADFNNVDMVKFIDGSGSGGGTPTPGQPPVANFSVNNSTGYAPLSVQFTDTSTNSPTSWSWTFGDNTTSTSRNPSKTYNSPGTYSVSLTASNEHGLDVETKNGYIVVSQVPVQGNLPGYIRGVEPECHAHVIPVCDTRGNLYRVTEEFAGTVTNGSPNVPMMYKSSDGGGTWSEVDRAGRPTMNDLEAVWVVQDSANKKIYVALCDGSVFKIHGFNTSDHPSAPDKWTGIDESVASGFSSGSRQWASMVRLSDGRMRAFYHVNSGGNINMTTRGASGGWTSNGIISTGSSDYGPVPVVGASDKVHVFFHDYAAKTIKYRTVTSTGTLSAVVRADTAGTNTNSRNYHAACNPVYYDANGAEVVTVLYAASNGVRAITIRNGAIQAEASLDSNAPTISPANTDKNTGTDGPSMHLAVHGTTVHAIWSRGTTGDLMYSTRTDGGLWTSPQVLWNSGSSSAFWVYNNVFQRAGVWRMGYTYDIGPHADNESNTHYNEVNLSGTGPVEPEQPTIGRRRERWNGASLITIKRRRWTGSALIDPAIEK